MTLMAGARLGPYELIAPIGAGGMGEVYRARDARLQRDVAIKVIAAAFADDPEGLRRFEQEAHAAAALNHPNILAIHDVGSGQPAGTTTVVHYVVSELLEGGTLREQLSSGPLSPRKAVDYAIQIANGLAAAHEKGIVHRDLKPENVFVTADDRVKILDFGLAKLHVGDTPFSGSSLSETTPQMTEPGRVMGTMGYMAPEMIRGQPVDGRADIFALGVLLFELLDGHNPFARDTKPDTMTAILREDTPEIHLSDGRIPGPLNRVIRRCLEKSREQRFQSARDLAFALDAVSDSQSASGSALSMVPPSTGLPIRSRQLRILAGRWAPWVIAAAASAVLVVVWRGGTTPSSRNHEGVMRFTIELPDEAPAFLELGASLAIARDGSQFVYVARTARGSQLYWRRMDDAVARPIPGTEGAEFPFFSPDQSWIGFFSISGQAGARLAGSSLKKLPLTGGVPVTITETPAFVAGATWEDDGTIFIGGPRLLRVPASGGTLEPITTPAKGIVAYANPQALGSALLFTIRPDNVTTFDDARIAIQRFDEQTPRVVIEGGGYAHYAPSGHLVYARGGAIWAAPFDASRLTVTGQPAQIVEGGMFDTMSARANFALSQNGTLIYARGGPVSHDYTLQWIDRHGRIEPVVTSHRYYRQPSFSADGTRVIMGIGAANDDIWLYDLARGGFARLTFAGGDNRDPIWACDDAHVIFAARRSGPENLFMRSADGTGAEERLSESPFVQSPGSCTHDGVLAFTEYRPTTRGDIFTISIAGDRSPKPVLTTPFDEHSPHFSPDGRSIAYVSDETGVPEVYVQMFPGPGRKRQVSIGGGTAPSWRRDGRELVYRDGLRLIAVPVATTPVLTVGQPKELLRLPARTTEVAMAPDGQRFMVVQRESPDLVASKLEVVLNWFDELRTKK